MAYDYRSQEEKDNQNYREYGTTNPKLIEEIKKKRKENRSFWIFITGLVIVVYMIMGGISKCFGGKGDPFREDNIGIESTLKSHGD